uniref:Uncharacterized protein n=1 Tax=Arundo donax TaxID=35708 RepID=A0A0A8XP30_ARUDO
MIHGVINLYALTTQSCNLVHLQMHTMSMATAAFVWFVRVLTVNRLYLLCSIRMLIASLTLKKCAYVHSQHFQLFI